MAQEQNVIHKPTKEEADKKLESIKPESAGGMSTDAAQFDPKTSPAPPVTKNSDQEASK